MSIPQLNHALLLEAPETVSDGAGGYVEGWVVLGTLWAEITARTGREAARIGAPVTRVNYKIVVRGAPFGTPERPSANQRFRMGARIFTIDAVTERDPQGRYLTCYAKEEQVV
ncbi:putative GTA head-tail adaptor [Sulfitobacter noctilucicola]|uniref:SPP1 family predicted phage head-tail adaptor n=1 Tax=Sulfitobacter noctilucicola TaxID=1342301 RepID=A0A7W6MBT2_9RHOB|nr:phage head closure protein [Sulfitobacter noctilucicola]KIN66302.1 putative GTA head-tail adaptor [Sulfitobacter noctilucicola]MBB4175653.1 SPP1 family predicted phage head-tail adaptor [Sulfitobacter noctilucicola]